MKSSKLLFIPAIKKPSLEQKNLSLEEFQTLPKQITLAYSLQYKPLAEKIKIFLSKHNFKILGFQQVLGCTLLPKSDKRTPLLLIGSGRFHAINLALRNNLQVYVYEAALSKISPEEIDSMKKQLKLKLNKFYISKNLGILVTTKIGQENLSSAKKLKALLEKKFPEKQITIFMSNNISLNELENFPIDLWINTACPGLAQDSSKIINADDISL